jgi:erythronate-4-phosphate dehydrogenase
LIKQLVHLIYDVRRDDARFRNRIGVAGSFDEQRKHYPERRELFLQLKGPSPRQTGPAGFVWSQ